MRAASAAVAKNTPRNGGLLIAAVIACMAEMPDCAGSRDNAVITKAEKAKKVPAIRPEPRPPRLSMR